MTNAITMAALIAALATPSIGAAQTPMFTLPYDQITQVVEPQIGALLEQDGRLGWDSDVHVDAGPGVSADAVRSSRQLKLGLHLNGDESVLGSALTTRVDVSVYLTANCVGGQVVTNLYAVNWDTSLPDWVQDLVVGDSSISQSALQELVNMVNNGLNDLPRCGDVRMWEDGMVIFPPDTLDALTSGTTVSGCSDSTSGRSGRVSIEDNTIVAELMPGTTERWPGSVARLNLWVSPDSDEANLRLLEVTLDQPMLDAGEGAQARFPLPDGVHYVGCDISW
jgi:hypothetical protein